MQSPRALAVESLGLVPYATALALQTECHAEVAAGQHQDTLFLLEHPAVITTGRNAGHKHLTATAEQLAAAKIDVVETSRGGDVTYHGPGQLVGYPIVALQAGEQDLKGYVLRLEDILIRTARDFGVAAERVEGLRGIWVGNDKLAAIGIRIARWVTMHGFALNVHTDLRAFDFMVPCGLHGRGVTSLARLCTRPPSMQDVQNALVGHAADVFKRRIFWPSRAKVVLETAQASALHPTMPPITGLV